MKLVIFDLDGTLMNTAAIDTKCFIDTFKTLYDVEVTNSDWSTYEHVTDTYLTNEILSKAWGRMPTKTELMKFREVFAFKLKAASQTNPEAFTEVDGASEFIDSLKKENIAIGFVTGSWLSLAAYKLRQIGFYIKKYPFSTADYHYNRSEILRNTIEWAKEYYDQPNFESVTYFGDGPWDYKTSKELGIKFVGVATNKETDLKKLGAKITIKNYNEIEQLKKII